MITDFKKILKTFIHNSIDDFFSNIKKSNLEKYEEKTYKPTFKSDGFYTGTEIITFTDYKKLVQDNWEYIKKKQYYNMAFLILKIRLQKNYSNKNIQKTSDQLKEITEKELRDFLISYVHEAGLIFTEKIFLRHYTNLEKYVEDELEFDYCFATLLNFDGDFNLLELEPENHLHIRRITPDEFSIVSEIKNKTEKPRVDPIYFKLKYIVGGRLPHSKVKEENVLKLFEKTINALKIFKVGDVRLGGIYFRDSEIWTLRPTYVLRKEPKFSSKNLYNLNSTQLVSQFKRFHKDFSSINFTKGKYPFLYRSFFRFSRSLENISAEECVVDFVTSLESLYSSQEQELSYKFALRIALLLGNSTKNKINLQDFMLKIYNMRSKIVHGDIVPDQIDVGNEKKILTKDDCIRILEDVTRNSINIFLSLIEEYNTKEDIQKEIDQSIHDPTLGSKYTKLIQKSKYVNLNFLDKLV